MNTHPLAVYLGDCRARRGTGATSPETSLYPALETLPNMVGRVGQVLRSDVGRPDGLADPGVCILDPCCGTGAYLVGVLNTIAGTLQDKGEGDLLAGRLKLTETEQAFGKCARTAWECEKSTLRNK